ncbi:molybdopterin molybdotransferase MoeA [Sphingopyxis macrogoltabida]|nr:molybdopterin molybdotransferase MoeA [Sphingopyxis macrogoltabida]ALJ16398.1 hypothetical protein LH19_26730 [Sphingopyxis macrogoltabida]
MKSTAESTADTICVAKNSFDSAQEILADHIRRLDVEVVGIDDAGGRWLAEPVLACLDAPRWDCAAMDGYAVRDADLDGGASVLRDIGTRYAGAGKANCIGPGEAMRVMTGANVPLGADRIVMIEDCLVDSGTIVLNDPPLGKSHIRRRGSDFTAGQILLPAGRMLTPTALAAAAAADHAKVAVVRQPRVLLIATGDEIAAPGSAYLSERSIPDSLSASIALQCRLAGGVLLSEKRLVDAPALIRSALSGSPADVVVIIGGASHGDRDFSQSALMPLGLHIAFAGVSIKPGKPVWYGHIGKTHILGIPGSPTAALTVARLFLVPLIAGLSGGDPATALDWRLQPTSKPLQSNGSREAFLCATCSKGAVEIFDRQEASAQAALASTNAIVRRAANAPAQPAGSLVPVLSI